MILSVTERAFKFDHATEEMMHASREYVWRREKTVIQTFQEPDSPEVKTRTDFYARQGWGETTFVQVVRKFNTYNLCTVGKTLVSVHFQHGNDVKEARTLEDLVDLDQIWARQFGA